MRASHSQPSGMVLLLALLIIGTVVGTATIFSNIILREIQQSRLIDQSMQSYYLAESGAERALYQVRKREAVIDCGTGFVCQDDGFCSDGQTPCVSQGVGTLPTMQGSWQVSVAPEDSTSIWLNRGDSFQLDLFSAIQTADSGVNEISVTSDQTGLTLYGELTNITNILQLGRQNCDDQPPVFKDFITAGTPFTALDGKNILGECSYTFRLNSPLNNPPQPSFITISLAQKVFDPQSGATVSQPVPIPSRLRIVSQAIFGNSEQINAVRTPIRPPLSGLYDFVIFSEQEIRKVK